MKSIQSKLTITILVIFLASLGTLGGLNYWKAREIITENVTTDMKQLAIRSAAATGDWLQAHRRELAMIASSPTVRGGDKAAIVPLLVAARNTSKDYDAIVFVDLNGDSISDSGFQISLTDKPYFKTPLSGQNYISDPMVSRATGHLITVIAVPVKNGEKVSGVLFGAISMEELNKTVLSIKVGQTGYAFVAQKDGLTIIHPDKEIAMKLNPLTDPNADSGRKANTGKMVAGEPGILMTDVGGVGRYFAYAPVPGMGWSLAVTVPVAEVTGAISALNVITLITTIVVLIIAGLIIGWYAKSIARPIGVLEEAARKITNGDISATKLNLRSNDEIGRLGHSFEQMSETLNNLVGDMAKVSEQVASSSQELTSSAEQSAQAANQIALSITDVANGAVEQVNAANTTSAVVEQMSRSIQQAAENADQVATQSVQAAAKASTGGKKAEQAVSQMSAISGSSQVVAAAINKLNDKSREIGQIVDAIAGIAGQTNLLALNAAIEAARAGEQGRGFAVVAEEVRKLAEESQTAAKKIATLIGEIQEDTEKAVDAMGNGAREVQLGTEMVVDAGHSFREIVSVITEVSNEVKGMSIALQQMASGSQQIVSSVQKIDTLSKKASGESQNVSAAAEEQLASMEEIASSSEALSKLAQDLQGTVSKFRR